MVVILGKIIAFFLLTFFEFFYILKIIEYLMEEKIRKRRFWLTTFFLYISYILISAFLLSYSSLWVFFNMFLILSLNYFILVICFSLKGKEQFMRLFLIFSFTYTLFFLSDYFFSLVQIYLISTVSIFSEGYLHIGGTVLTMYLFSRLTKRFNTEILYNNLTVSKLVSLLSLFFATLSLFFLIYSQVYFYLPVKEIISSGHSALLSTSLLKMTLGLLGSFIFSVTVIYLLSFHAMSTHRLKEKESTVLQQNLYIKKLEFIQTEVRMMRHDYKNIISGLYLQVQEGDLEGIKKSMEDSILDFDQQIGDSIQLTTQLSNITISEVKSLLLVKIKMMEDKGIRCQLEIPHKLERVNMSLGDFNRSLGILIDNAIEEIEHSLSLERKITILLLQESENITVLVKNPVVQKPKINRINETGYSTKGKERGLGLSSYQRILSKYPHVMKQSSYKENEFIQVFKIRNR